MYFLKKPVDSSGSGKHNKQLRIILKKTKVAGFYQLITGKILL